MDLSKLSDSDLMALKTGKLSNVSTDGLMILKGSEPKNEGFASDIVKGAGNLVAGAVRGAGSIGATILAPYDMAVDAIKGDRGKTLSSLITGKELPSRNQERRTAIDEGLSAMGVDTESIPYAAGKLGGEIAGTAGAGGLIAQGARAIPVLAKAAPGVIDAIGSSGMGAGSIGARTAGGAVSGGAQAALVNPEDAATGATIGAALPMSGKIINGGVSLARKAIGATTGAGDEALVQAYRAGKQGGQTAQTFKDAMRGDSSMEDVLSSAKQGIENLGRQKQAAYRSGMQGIKQDKTVLDMSKIGQAADDALQILSFKGQVKNEKAADALQGIKEEITKWRSLNPGEYHTPEGLDALKQKIGGMVEEIPFEQKTARLAAGNVYKAIKNEISSQAPEYSKVMKDYSKATDTIKEIEKSLSLGNKATAETGIRKLQSLMRNNVNTSYGYRGELANVLEQQGGNEIRPALAGQALNDWVPRGIQRAATGSGGAALALTGNVPAAIGLGAISSPRLVGEALYGAGKISPNERLSKLLKSGVSRSSPILGQQDK